jgi:SSS family transporter
MDWLHDHALQLLFVVGYLILLAYHGWRGSRRTRSLDDYLIGGRGLGGVIIALSFYATFVSSVTFVGHAGRSYTRGPAWWITCVVVFTSMVLLAWFVVAPPFMSQAKRFGALTIPDFLGHRYKSIALRRVAGIVIVAASLVYMVAVYDAAAQSLTELLDLDAAVVLIVIFLVVTAYTLSGGFHSVVATDAVQGLVLFGGAIVLPVMMIARKGGIGPLLDAVREAQPTALDWTGDMPLVTMIGLALGVGLKFVVEPRQLSRFYGLASEEQLRRGRWIAPALLFLTYLFMLPVGIFAHAFVAREAVMQNGAIVTKRVVPELLGDVNVLGPVLGAFFLTALVAAAMSSVDSVLLVAASSVDHDVISPGRTQAAAMRWTRLWVLVLSAAAAALAVFRAEGIVEMSSFSGSIYAACFLPALVVGLFWQRATRAGGLASVIAGFSVTTAWFYAKKSDAFQELAWLHEVYVGIAISLPVYIVVSLLTKREGEDQTES